jgi:hypothetical protein
MNMPRLVLFGVLQEVSMATQYKATTTTTTTTGNHGKDAAVYSPNESSRPFWRSLWTPVCKYGYSERGVDDDGKPRK